MRRAIQIPSAAHCALEYQRWAVRSQLRSEGWRFMKAMNRQLDVPLLHLHGDADPYVLADPVDRTQRYALRGRYVALAGVGHFAHEEAPQESATNTRAGSWPRCTAWLRDAGPRSAPSRCC